VTEENVAVPPAILETDGVSSKGEILRAAPRTISAPFHPSPAWIEAPERVVYDGPAGGPALA
jgi:hypothetical protein